MKSTRTNRGTFAHCRLPNTIIAFAALFICLPTLAATYRVNSTGDAADSSVADNACDTGQTIGGNTECTLRAAISQANFSAGAHDIEFAIVGAGPFLLQPATSLPTITANVRINGFSQSGASSSNLGRAGTLGPERFSLTLMIQLDGSLLAGNARALQLEGPAGDVRGLAITNFPVGIISNCDGGCEIDRNYIGLAPDGSHEAGLIGVSMGDGRSHSIHENVITSDGGGRGIVVANRNITGVRIRNNLVGSDPTGMARQGMTDRGMQINGTGTTISENLVGHAVTDGILIQNSASDTRLYGNFVGVAIDGGRLTGSPSFAVGINVAPANVQPGLLPNLIGGPDPFQANVISDNPLEGIKIESAHPVIIEGNLIGTSASGVGILGNSGSGIWIQQSSGDPSVAHAVLDNLIAFNRDAGVRIGFNNVVAVTVSGNRIFENVPGNNLPGQFGGLGIDIKSGDAVTANVLTDNITDFPTLTKVERTPTMATFHGTVTGGASEIRTLEFFSSNSCDPLLHGEGEFFWGAEVVMLDGSGNNTFSVPLLGNAQGSVYTATATSPEGATSEFSACLTTASIDIRDSLLPDDDMELDFGNVPPGSSATATVTVRNTGSASFDVTAVGALTAPFEIVDDTCSSVTLAASETCEVDVRFAPVTNGTENDAFNINILANGIAQSFTLTVSGDSLASGADLSVAKVVDKPGAVVGDQLMYTITVANAGPEDATGIVVEDPLPSGIAFVSSSSVPAAAYDPVTGIWSVGALASGTSATLTMHSTVLAGADETTISNRAEILAGYMPSDPDLNDHASIAETVVGGADLELVSFARVDPSENPPLTEYRAVFRNNGPGGARGVELALDLPVRAENPSVVPGDSVSDQMQCNDLLTDVSTGAHRFSCTLPIAVAISASQQFNFIVAVDRTGNLDQSTLTVTTATVDTDPNNNSLSVNVTFEPPISITPTIDDFIENQGSWCFVATAAYGSYLEPEVVTLRNFRDRWLLSNRVGRAFVGWYYRNSPEFAAWIAKREWARTLTRMVLAPVVYAIKYPWQTVLVLTVLTGWRRRMSSQRVRHPHCPPCR